MTRTSERQKLLKRQVEKSKAPSLPSVAPASVKQILEAEAAKPLKGSAKELQYEGLFGEAQKQTSLF